MAALGNHLKALRTEAGLTQAQLAEKIGVSRKTINTIENKTKIQYPTAKAARVVWI